MTAHAITLHLPETLYKRFQQRAEWTHRSLETELLDAVASAASVEGELSPELIEAIAALDQLGDEELWRLAKEAMSREASQQLESLHLKQRDEGLSQDEDATRAMLIQEYERSMLIRAQAAKLLKDRGHDVSRIRGRDANRWDDSDWSGNGGGASIESAEPRPGEKTLGGRRLASAVGS